MSAPSEPEKYSIDEMMDRLKSRPAEIPLEDGELVTRADGSQAIRVRKRKRRSHQPHKEERRNQRRARMLQVSGGLILLLLALFVAGVAIAYANSAPFREGLIKKIALSSGADVEILEFRMNPTSANAKELSLKWPDGNALRDLNLRGIKARISPVSFLGKTMTGEEVTFAEGALNLRIPESNKPLREAPPMDAPAVSFNHYNTPKFQLLIGDPAAPKILLSKSEATFVPPNADSRPQLRLSRGEIHITGWPNLRMDRSHIEFRGDEVDIVGMRIRHENDTRGVFELSGTIAPYAPDRASTLAVRLESYPVSGIAGAELGRLFDGRIDTLPSASSDYLSLTLGPDPASSLSVTFHSALASPFEVTGFPFLSGLSRTLDDEWFSRPVFDTATSGVLRRENGNVAIDDLRLENKGRMALRGEVAMASNRMLSGQLEVGISEGMIKTSGNSRLDSMFGPAREGFRWITLKIGGLATNPTDNFKDLYEAAASGKAQAPPGGVPSFEELTRPK